MNVLIETLNRYGHEALRFAWPMLWQSSLLIAVLFATDFALRRHVRAAVRYALWLVLLVKLVLPPSLALPTGAAWWLFPSFAPPAKTQTTKFVVNYGPDTIPSLPPQPAPVFVPPPRPPMSAAAWTILFWSAISAGLLVWFTVRWRQVARVVRRATPAPPWLGELFDEAKSSTGLRRAVRLRLTDHAMSPAVCGLFRPVILLPQSLVQKLPPAQLRAVLLHELTHLRRGDVWMNCAQALAQIVYWWHPLLWFANTRIRRLREEAVDDVVMLALRDDAVTYAPTLLEVAKLAFYRPLASLGLVGILESRSALRQRIERLMDFRAPRKAGLTIMSFLGIFIFSAAALPMGEATNSADKQPVAQATQPEQSLTVKVNPEVFIKNVKAQAGLYLHNTTNDYTDILLNILRGEGVNCSPPHGLAFNTKTGEITTQNTPEALEIFRQVIEQLNRPDGQCNLLAIPIHRQGVLIQGEFYIMRTSDFENLTKDLHLYDNPRFSNLPWWSVEPDQFAAFGNRIKSLGLHPFQRPRVQTSHGMTAELYCGNETNSIDLSCLPFVTVDQTQRFVALTVQVNTKGWFTDNLKGDWPVHDGTNRYAISGQVSAEDHGGIVLRAKNPAGDNLVVVLGVEIVTNDAPPAQFRERQQVVTSRMNKNPAVINGIVAVVGNPKASPPLSTSNSTDLETRTFKVDTNAFLSALATIRPQIGGGTAGDRTNTVVTLRDFFARLDVDLSPPKSIFFNDDLGLLFVRATTKDLDTIERAVQMLNYTPPQIHIKARFIEVPEEMTANLGANFIPTSITNVTGILTDPNFRLLVHNLEKSKETETLAEPEVVTLSGRQTQMRATEIMATVITNFVYQETASNGAITPQSEKVELGPVLDVVPSVLPDGFTIDLKMRASAVEFLGYDKPTNTIPTVASTGVTIDVPTILPSFHIRQANAHLKLWDGQTVVLGRPQSQFLSGGKEVGARHGAKDKELLVFVTVNLVDRAGNRIHTDDEMQFAQKGIPPQDSH